MRSAFKSTALLCKLIGAVSSEAALRALSVTDLSSVSRFERQKELSFLHKKKTAHPGESVNLQRAATVAYSDAQPVTATHFPLPVPTRIDLLLFALDEQEAQISSLTQISPLSFMHRAANFIYSLCTLSIKPSSLPPIFLGISTASNSWQRRAGLNC
ncbi:hypothetical protein DFH06DRAFT_1210353 [Mycena polygramma]|nr:hypothetical protein DFH06DRAFT_1210353 [Mycena polygramma]